MTVHLSPKAAEEVQSIMAQNNLATDGTYLRMGIKGGGCSGVGYSLDLTENRKEDDVFWQHHGVQIICDPRSFLHLTGVTVDFKDGVTGRGFVFENPNTTGACDCPSSH